MTARRSQRPRAPGPARVLAIGIDDYARECGFEPRSTCRNDALAVSNCFRDIPQLHADPAAITTLVSRGAAHPSRGEILKATLKLAQSTVEGDRLIFFFSGHGHRIAGDPELYLVPQDAYTNVDRTCLLGLSAITKILDSAAATHKLIVLDVSHAGPFLAEIKPKPRRAAILCSSGAPAPANSPNPQHSSFTAHLLPALRGAVPGALRDQRLTFEHLHHHLSAHLAPIPYPSSAAGMLLADFSGSLLDPDALGLDGALFDRIALSARGRSVALKDILKKLGRTTYTQSYLESRANDALGEYMEAELGQAVSRLRAHFKWASSEVHAEGGGISFPDGAYQARYEAATRAVGTILEELSLSPVWLERPGAVADLLACLGLEPQQIRFALRRPIVPGRCIPKLQASGWSITSELQPRIEASHDGCALVLQSDALTLSGLPLRALFAATPDPDAVRTASAALAIFGA